MPTACVNPWDITKTPGPNATAEERKRFLRSKINSCQESEFGPYPTGSKQECINHCFTSGPKKPKPSKSPKSTKSPKHKSPKMKKLKKPKTKSHCVGKKKSDCIGKWCQWASGKKRHYCRKGSKKHMAKYK